MLGGQTASLQKEGLFPIKTVLGINSSKLKNRESLQWVYKPLLLG